MTTLLFLAFIGLLVLGPKKLPGILKTVGRLYFEYQRASDDFKRKISAEFNGEPDLLPRPAVVTVVAPVMGEVPIPTTSMASLFKDAIPSEHMVRLNDLRLDDASICLNGVQQNQVQLHEFQLGDNRAAAVGVESPCDQTILEVKPA